LTLSWQLLLQEPVGLQPTGPASLDAYLKDIERQRQLLELTAGLPGTTTHRGRSSNMQNQLMGMAGGMSSMFSQVCGKCMLRALRMLQMQGRGNVCYCLWLPTETLASELAMVLPAHMQVLTSGCADATHLSPMLHTNSADC
jgi:hypothetical protein